MSPTVSDKRERRRILKRAITLLSALVVVTLVVGFVAGLPHYVFPESDETSGADAIFVLGPPNPSRIQLATDISAREGDVPVYISVASEGSRSASTVAACVAGAAVCRVPHPFTTKGEAKLAAGVSARHGYRTLVIITSAPHVERARYIFQRCTDIDVRVVGVPFSGSFGGLLEQYLYQSTAAAYAALTDCE